MSYSRPSPSFTFSSIAPATSAGVFFPAAQVQALSNSDTQGYWVGPLRLSHGSFGYASSVYITCFVTVIFFHSPW